MCSSDAADAGLGFATKARAVRLKTLYIGFDVTRIEIYRQHNIKFKEITKLCRDI
jgi:hypothetical protein